MSRTEQDFLGQREIADDIYYGVQTIRGKENFHITGIPMNQEPYFVKALGYVKKAAAMANRDLGAVDTKVAEAIILGCDRVIAGDMMDQFVTDFIQGGAGTSTNMNANEVIANLALESLGFAKGDYQHVSPNDHVNYGQSTNDTYPTAFRLALILRLESYMTALRQLQEAFFAKGREFERVLKMGRTHLQDAVPMSLGAEFRGWGTTMGEEVDRISEARALLREINLGATAIGTSVTAAHGYPKLAVRHLSALTGVDFILAGDLVEATSDTGAYVQFSGVLKRTASKLTKICNDIRLLASGPRAGFNEINLPQLQPGSSIMPGKVNPVIPEVVNQTSFLVIGLDTTVTLAAVRRPAPAQRDGAGDLVRAVLLDPHHGARRQQPARELRGRHHRQPGAHPQHGAELAGYRHGAEAAARLQAMRRDRARGLQERQVAAPDRRGRAQAADAGDLGRDVLVRAADQSGSACVNTVARHPGRAKSCANRANQSVPFVLTPDDIPGLHRGASRNDGGRVARAACLDWRIPRVGIAVTPSARRQNAILDSGKIALLVWPANLQCV